MKKKYRMRIAFMLVLCMLVTANVSFAAYGAEDDRGQGTEEYSTEEVVPEGTETVETTETTEMAEDSEAGTETEGTEETTDPVIDGPVVTGFSLEENGQTVEADTMLHFTLNAYDAASTITRADVSVLDEERSRGWTFPAYYMNEVSAGCWSIEEKTGTVLIGAMNLSGEYKITGVTVYNEAGLGTYYGLEDCSVTYLAPEMKEYTGSVKLISDNEVYSETDQLQFEATLDDADSVPDMDGLMFGTAEVAFSKGNWTGNFVYYVDMAFKKFEDVKETKTLQISMSGEKFSFAGEYSFVNIEIPMYDSNYNQVGTWILSPDTETKVTVSKKPAEKGQVEKVTFDKQEQKVKTGDTLNLEVELSEMNEMPDQLVANFSPKVNPGTIVDSFSFMLEKEEGTRTYKGTYTIPKNLYSCEWDLYIWTSNAQEYEIKYDSGKFDNYFYCVNGGTFISQNIDVQIDLYEKVDNETMDGCEFETVKSVKKTIQNRSTIGGIVGELPTLPDYDGEKFVGWVDEKGNFIDENAIIKTSGTYTYYASFENTFIYFDRDYVTTDKKWVVVRERVKCPYNATIAEASKYVSIPEDMMCRDLPITWLTFQHGTGEDEYVIGNPWYVLWAVPEGKKELYVTGTWIGKDLELNQIGDAVYIDEDMSTEEIEEYVYQNYSILNQDVKDVVPDGFEADGWKTSLSEFRFGWDFVFEANCKKAAIIYGYTDEKGNEIRVPVFGEAGEKIELPETLPGYEYVKWRQVRLNSYGEKVYTPIDASWLPLPLTTYIYEMVVEADPAGRTDPTPTPDPVPDPDPTPTPDPVPDPDPTPTPNPTPTPDSTPVVTLPEEKITESVDKVNNAESGETITVKMDSATVVPAEVLEAAQGKDVEIQLDMGSYSWTIKGTDIKASELKDINLEVKLDQNAVAPEIVEKITDGKPSRQLSLTYDGEFGFKAELTVNLGAENAGEYANLYYYDYTGRLVFMNAGIIDADGNVSLNFTHASDYVVVIDQKDRTSQETTTTPEAGQENGGQNQDQNNGNQTDAGVNGNNNMSAKGQENMAGQNASTTNGAAPETGDTLPILLLVIFLMIGVGFIGASVTRKKNS